MATQAQHELPAGGVTAPETVVFHRTFDANDAISAIVAANGKVELAAERLSKQFGAFIRREDLIATICQDGSAADNLMSQIRTLTTFQVFESFQRVAKCLDDALDKAEPKDVIAAYKASAELLGRLTDSKTTTNNVNITEVVLRMLPPGVREAVMDLAQAPAAVLDAAFQAGAGQAD